MPGPERGATRNGESNAAADVRPEALRYWGFLSYSRSDAAWAKRVQAWLERFPVPAVASETARARGLDTRRMRPIFRDVDELAASSDLSGGIRAALDAAAYIVVLCSPRSARSKWVEAEVRHVIARGNADRILLLVIDGEPRVAEGGVDDPAAAFSPALADLPAEPNWVDARSSAESPRRALTRLAAGMLGVGFDELWKRHTRQRRARLIAGSGAGTVIAGVLAALIYLQSRPVDIADCRLGAVEFRDPWIGTEFIVQQVGTDYIHLCGDDWDQLRSPEGRSDCTGPYGPTVLRGLLVSDGVVAPASQAVYFVFHQIKGAPASWWDAFDEADVRETVTSADFRWLPEHEEPRMRGFGFGSIDLDEHSTISESLDLLENPLIASVCSESRLDRIL